MKSSSQEIEEWRRAGFSVPERSLFMFDRWMHISLEFMVRYYVLKWGLKRRKPMKYLAVVALLLAGCFASLCEAKEPSKFFTPEVGKEYELVAEGKVPLMVLYGIEVDSFLKLLGARDMVGITSMVEARRAGVMPEGHTIRVLELTKPSMFQKYGYAECRLQQGDVDAGKWCIPLLFFQKTHLTPATK